MDEFCVENLLFWLDVETFRYCEADENVVLIIARRIFINYISADGQLQINLNSDTRFPFFYSYFSLSLLTFTTSLIFQQL